MGGTYYRSPAPGEPPFCREGDKVTKGQTIGIIEAMKLMNEIEVCHPPTCSSTHSKYFIRFTALVTGVESYSCGW